MASRVLTFDEWLAFVLAVNNDLIAATPAGCVEVLPLPVPTSPRQWKKATDILAAKNKLGEICPEFDFDAAFDLALASGKWKEVIITELNAARLNGWCACGDLYCTPERIANELAADGTTIGIIRAEFRAPFVDFYIDSEPTTSAQFVGRTWEIRWDGSTLGDILLASGSINCDGTFNFYPVVDPDNPFEAVSVDGETVGFPITQGRLLKFTVGATCVEEC